jgi:hypothetical protein
MKKTLTQFALACACMLATLSSEAKVWRVNNNVGVVADFTQPQLAHDAATVAVGDTLHIEASANAYGGLTMTKRLVLIGLGYNISGTDANTGLQASANNASMSTINIDSSASGSSFLGLEISNVFTNYSATYLNNGTDNITITRCKISSVGYQYGGLAPAGIKANNWIINKCFFTNAISANSFNAADWKVTNCIFLGSVSMNSANNFNSLIRNNIIRGGADVRNCYFSNNIIYSTLTATNTTVRYNTAIGNLLPQVAGDGNVNNATEAAIFVATGGYSTNDGYYKLKTGSSAIGTGETISSITPDRGAFGTADPYLLSGIPPIPSIYALTVPVSIPSTATSMTISISTKSNN